MQNSNMLSHRTAVFLRAGAEMSPHQLQLMMLVPANAGPQVSSGDSSSGYLPQCRGTLGLLPELTAPRVSAGHCGLLQRKSAEGISLCLSYI